MKKLTKKQAARYLRRFFGLLDSPARSQTLMRTCRCGECSRGTMTDVQDGDIETREEIAEFVRKNSNFQLWRK